MVLHFSYVYCTIHKSLEKIYNSKITECEIGKCGDHILEESMNCVAECVSRKCYQEASFDVDPLEDGEIDETRILFFSKCVKNDISRQKYADRERNKAT